MLLAYKNRVLNFNLIFFYDKDSTFNCNSVLQFSSISMVVLGVLLKEDNKMTGTAVYNIYQYLYFGGVNYNDIVEAMYLNLIVLGVLSFSCCLLGISDIFKILRHRVKLKFVSIIGNHPFHQNKLFFISYIYKASCIIF